MQARSLPRSEQTIAPVAEPGNNAALLNQALVEGGSVDGDVGVMLVEGFDADPGSGKTHELEWQRFDPLSLSRRSLGILPLFGCCIRMQMANAFVRRAFWSVVTYGASLFHPSQEEEQS